MGLKSSFLTKKPKMPNFTMPEPGVMSLAIGSVPVGGPMRPTSNPTMIHTKTTTIRDGLVPKPVKADNHPDAKNVKHKYFKKNK